MAGKPGVPHPGLVPTVISLNAPAAVSEYKSGFRNPRVGLPALSRTSFTSATMLAKVGLEALVPRIGWGCPATTTTMSRPCVATSGNARPVLLNLPARGFVGSELDVNSFSSELLSHSYSALVNQ